jgi:hypothetical protein
VIDATHCRGRSFNTVYHPAPEAEVISGAWDIEVRTGPEQI